MVWEDWKRIEFLRFVQETGMKTQIVGFALVGQKVSVYEGHVSSRTRELGSLGRKGRKGEVGQGARKGVSERVCGSEVLIRPVSENAPDCQYLGMCRDVGAVGRGCTSAP